MQRQRVLVDIFEQVDNMFYNMRTEDLIEDTFWEDYWKRARDWIIPYFNELKSYIINYGIERIIPTSSRLINKIDTFIAFANKLNKEYEELESLASQIRSFMVFKKREYRLRFSQFKRDTTSLISLLKEINVEFLKFREAYYNEVRNSAENTQDGITITDHEDYLCYRRLIAEGSFESKDYRKLKKFVFPMINVPPGTEFSVRASTIYNLLNRLRDKRQNRIYWVNVKKFSSWYHAYPMKVAIVEEEIFIFFDEDLFFIWERILPSTIIDKLRDRGFLLIKKVSRLYSIKTKHLSSNYFLSFGRYLTIMRSNGEEHKIKLARDNVERLSGRLAIEDTLYSFLPGLLINTLTPEMIDLLIACDIRKIHNLADVDLLNELKNIFNRHSNFRSIIGKIAKYWKDTVNKDLRDVHHFSIFIRVFDLIGLEFFDELKRLGIVLDSGDMQDILFMMKDPGFYLFRESPLALIFRLRQPARRKLVLITIPREDHNFAFQRMYAEMEKFSNEKFKVYFYYVNHPYHLAELIRKVSKEKKIDLFLFGAHGTESYAGYLDEAAILSPYFDGINECFEKDGKMYLFSCSTGKEDDSIAEKISKRFGVEVIAPKIDTSADIEIDSNGEIKIHFRDGGERSFKP